MGVGEGTGGDILEALDPVMHTAQYQGDFLQFAVVFFLSVHLL